MLRTSPYGVRPKRLVPIPMTGIQLLAGGGVQTYSGGGSNTLWRLGAAWKIPLFGVGYVGPAFYNDFVNGHTAQSYGAVAGIDLF